MRRYARLALLLVPALLLTACGGEEATTTPEGGDAAAEPSKEALVGVLNDLHAAIVGKQYVVARTFLIAPPDMTADDWQRTLDGFVEKREISAAGIEILAEEGTYGSAGEILGDRAESMAKRAGVSVDDCYALTLDNAEVAGIWDGTTFKIFRLNNVGKLD